MWSLNSIFGALLGLAAATVGIVCQPMVEHKLAMDLAAKEREIPEVLAADGSVETPKRLVINDIDRIENQRRVDAYHQGSQYLMFNAFAWMALGLFAAPGLRGKQVATIGGSAFAVSAVLMASFPVLYGIWNWEIVMIATPIGALAFLLGWVAIVISMMLPKRDALAVSGQPA